jgi:hypothetical protein
MKERDISLGRRKPKRLKLVTQLSVPCMWRLLETLECVGELSMIGWIHGINKPRWLLHINSLLKNIMKERVLNIQLTKCPTIRDCKR